MTDRLLETGAADTARLIASGEVSPDEVLDFWVTRAGTDRMNSFLWRADAGQAAAAADRPATGPGAGVPVAVKDNICVEGAPTTAASRILDGYRPPYTATVAHRLSEAGLPLLGKTNLDEFAMGSSNETSAFGPALNPWDPSRVPGGSSGGSAAAVAAGLAPWALGTDTGGSIRQPAAFCGLVGLKPTYGAVSRFGIIAFASSFDQCGPITRDVTDAALLFGVIQGRDPMDATSVGVGGELSAPAARRLDGLRFGVPRNLIGESVDAAVAGCFEQTLERITGLGGEIVEIDLPHAGHAVAAFYILAPAEASTNLARFDGVRYGLRATNDDLLSMYEVTRDEGFGAEVKRRIMLGTYTLSSGYYDAWYSRAQRVRTRIIEDFDRAWDTADFIVTPTTPTVAFGLGEHFGDPLAMYQGDLFTVPMSLAGVPAISIPAGTAVPAAGGPELPVGFQIAAPAFGEQKLLEAAFALEQEVGFDSSPARKTPGAGGTEGGAA